MRDYRVCDGIEPDEKRDLRLAGHLHSLLANSGTPLHGSASGMYGSSSHGAATQQLHAEEANGPAACGGLRGSPRTQVKTDAAHCHSTLRDLRGGTSHSPGSWRAAGMLDRSGVSGQSAQQAPIASLNCARPAGTESHRRSTRRAATGSKVSR